MSNANDETEYDEIEIDLYNVGKILRFTGRLLAESDDSWIAGREQDRWTDYQLFITKSGKYILIDEFQTRWQGEICRIDYKVFTKGELIEYVKEKDDSLLNDLMIQAEMPIVIEIE